MGKPYSDIYKSTLAQVSVQETPLILLEINHSLLASPVRVVNDMQNITSNGYEYIACPFRCVMPDDLENQLPKAQLSVDNVSRDLMYWIETSGGGKDSTVRFIQVMRSRPNQIEWEITMNLYNVNVNMKEISAELGFDNLFGKQAIRMQYRPENSPGLF